jgi:hypothetical protein
METPPINRLYAYIDESGQDTLGRFFVVGAVVIDRAQRDTVAGLLEALEARSQKGRVKWGRARFSHRQVYVSELANITRLSSSLFLARFTNTRRYHEATAQAAVRAILTKSASASRVRMTVDGLTAGEKRGFTRIVRSLGIRPDDVRGGREQSEVFIRLADALCGLVRDAEDGQSWAIVAFDRLRQRGLIVEI